MKIRIMAAAIVMASLLLIFGIRFIDSVQEDEWKIQRNAVQTAYQKTILTKAVKVDRFVGDKAYTVIQGEDKIGQKIIVWVGEDNNVYSQMASEGVTADKIKELVTARHPEAVILRLMPGVLNGNLIWEAFYKVDEADNRDGSYYYDYYMFKDGSYMDTYRLSIQ